MKNKFSLIMMASLSLMSVVAFDAHADRWAETTSGKTPFTASTGGSDLSKQDTKMGGTKAPYEACSGFVMVESSDFQKNKSYWKQRMDKCDAKVANCSLKVQVVPDSGMLASRAVVPGLNVSGAMALGDFLESVRKEAVVKLSAGIKTKEEFAKRCLGAGSSNKDCDTTIDGLRKKIAPELPAFRNAVAMMGVPGDTELQRAIVTGDVSGLINKDLGSNKTFKRVPKMDPLTKDEYAKVEKEFKALIAKARVEFAKETEELLKPLKVKGSEVALANQRKLLSRAENFTVKVKELMAAQRLEKFTAYNNAIGKVPEIAYIGDGKASREAIAAGHATMIADAQDRLNDIKKAPASKDLAAKKVDGSILQYAAYSSLINEMLIKETASKGTSSCAIATAGFNQLKTNEARNAGWATAAIVGVTVAGLAAAPIAGAFGFTMTAGAVGVATNVAIASGIIGGFAMTGADIAHAASMSQGERLGLVTQKDAEEARDSAGIGALASPLNFMGGGALFGAGVAASAKVASKMGVLSRFGAAAAAKGEVVAAGATAREVGELAAKATGAVAATTAKVATAKAGTEAVTSASTKAIAVAEKRLKEIGDSSVKKVLGRTADSTDEKAMELLVPKNLMGNVNEPHVEALKTYGEITAKMSAKERKAYVNNLEKVTKTLEAEDFAARGAVLTNLSGEAKAKAIAEAAEATARREAAALAALHIAAEASDPAAAAAILKAGSGFGSQEIQGVAAVWEAARKLGKGVKEVVGGKVKAQSERFQAAFDDLYFKATGKKPTPEVRAQSCRCVAACPVVAMNESPLKVPAKDGFSRALASVEEKPVFMACVAH